MAFIDIKFPKSFYRALRIPASSTKRQQLKVLQKLLKRARFTEFGQKYLFDQILLSKNPAKNFQHVVPTFTYEKIFNKWWVPCA